MSKQFDPLKTTAPELLRFWFMVSTEKQWYDIMRECRSWFGKNWRGMAKVRRKLTNRRLPGIRLSPLPVWFEVPDPRFATWISVKMSLQVQSDAKYQDGK
jgi:hypothetical protein